MRQQLVRRLLPLPGSLGYLSQSVSAAPAGFQSFHFSSRDLEEKRESSNEGKFAAPTPSLVQLANLVNRPTPPTCSLPSASFAASPLLGMRSRRGPAGLTRRPALPLLPGMGGPTSTSPARSYYTEGEIFGTTFMYTTNMMFWAGIVGAVAFRRNLIILLLSAETVMLACNMNFLFAAAYLNDITGAIMSITITTIAACETAIGLALCVAYFHMRSATDVEALNLLK